tara:strand:- start:963 stop:1340 length:378 start_codon:yes stop_codon:yes gene_type:complete
MKRYIFLTAAILGGLSIVFGAFGAHLLEDYLVLVDRVNAFDTAVSYQFYHVFFLVFLGFGYDSFHKTWIKYSFFTVLVGVMFFSGSLYLLCLTNNSFFGMLTPFGGLSLICAWIMCFLAIRYSSI